MNPFQPLIPYFNGCIRAVQVGSRQVRLLSESHRASRVSACAMRVERGFHLQGGQLQLPLGPFQQQRRPTTKGRSGLLRLEALFKVLRPGNLLTLLGDDGGKSLAVTIARDDKVWTGNCYVNLFVRTLLNTDRLALGIGAPARVPAAPAAQCQLLRSALAKAGPLIDGGLRLPVREPGSHLTHRPRLGRGRLAQDRSWWAFLTRLNQSGVLFNLFCLLFTEEAGFHGCVKEIQVDDNVIDNSRFLLRGDVHLNGCPR